MRVFDKLDGAASANLTAVSLKRFHAYKAELIERGIDDAELEEVLRGYIWDSSEDDEGCE